MSVFYPELNGVKALFGSNNMKKCVKMFYCSEMFVQNYNLKYHYTENKSQKCNLIWFNLLKIRQIVRESFLGVRNDMGYYFTRTREGED